MCKKISFIRLVALLVVMTAGRCFADVSAQFEQAETYEEQGQYEQAEQIYQQIAADYPGSDDAFEAREKLTCLYVSSGRELDAEAGLAELLASFSGHEAIAAAVTHVGDAYRESEKYEKACEIYDYVVSNWREDEYAMWSQANIVVSNACLGNNAAADTAFEELRTQYSEHKLISQAVCMVADNYRKLKKHSRAWQLYRYNLVG
ncbi:MAG: tetratricopeptide repeat protein [Planctomycetota bacterium]|jgi:TolA-binding protein